VKVQSADRGRVGWSDNVIGIVLFMLTVVSRLPFCSRVLYHWDSVNFALALERYDVGLHRPHPPGYVLYVLLGRAVQLVLGDANASLIAISIAFSGLAVAMAFLLGKEWFGRPVALVSGLLALTSPLLWFEGEVALSYAVEAFFVSLVAYVCYRAVCGDSTMAYVAALILGIAGGFRQNTLVLLAPLWLYMCWRIRWKRAVLATAFLAAIVAAWLAVMCAMTGGAAAYWQALTAQATDNAARSAVGIQKQLTRNLLRLAVYGGYALTAGVVPLLFGVYSLVRDARRIVSERRWQVVGVWLLPSLAFYVFFVQQAGYTMTFMPAVYLVLAYVLVERPPAVIRSRLRYAAWIATGIVMVSNVAFFFAAPPFLFGQQRQLFNTPSWPSIRYRSATVGDKVSVIRSRFRPDETAVLAGRFDFNLPTYYFGDYQVPTLSYDMLDSDNPLVLVDEVQVLVLFNEELLVLCDKSLRPQPIELASGERLYWLSKPDRSDRWIVSPERIALVSAGGTP